jgi:S1-C subfamily serine protease
VPTPFEGHEVEARLRPSAEAYRFDLDQALASMVALEATVPPDAYTAGILGTERVGNGVVVGPGGLVLTMAYLITEATDVILTRNDGRRVPAHVLGLDVRSGLGLVQALEPLDLPVMTIGSARDLDTGDAIIAAGAGGRAHAVAGKVLARMPFAGYWEYLLDDAIITGPAHPHWSGAALIGPKGDLVGLGSLTLEGRDNEGLARPINMFVPAELLPPVLDELARGRSPHPPRPWLGVFAQETENHVIIVGISPKGPAARAELAAGDLILAVDGMPVSTLAEFYESMWSLGDAGVSVPLKIRREGDVFEVEVRSMDRASLLKKRRLN